MHGTVNVRSLKQPVILNNLSLKNNKYNDLIIIREILKLNQMIFTILFSCSNVYFEDDGFEYKHVYNYKKIRCDAYKTKIFRMLNFFFI